MRIGSPPGHSRLEPRRDAAADAASVDAVLAALDAGDMEQAASLSDQALKSGLKHPVPLCVMAMSHELRRRFAEAIPYLMQALELAPTDSSTMLALARCLLGVERPGDALAVIEAALELTPDYANAHAYKGQALGQLGWVAREEESYARALALDPANIVAKAGVATLCSHFGEHRKARALALEVLEAAPDDGSAALVVAMADIEEGAPAAAEARIRALIAAQGPSPLLSSHLGDALDAQGRVKEAFEAYVRYGEALHRLHRAQYPGDGVLEAAERAADLLERLPAGLWPRRPARRPDPPGVETHVFLLGFARSGTSLLALALEGDDRVESLQEQEPLKDALHHFAGPEGLSRLLAAADAELAALRTAYWDRVRSAGAALDRPVFVDKQPMNSLHLPLIARLFPGAKVLFARRDPRDVVLSCFRQRFLVNRYTYPLLTLDGAARLYAAAMRIADAVGSAALLDTLPVAHEDLVEDFDWEMDRVCGFLGVARSDAMWSFSSRVRTGAVATASAAQLARGLNSDGVGQWRRYARQLEPLEPLLGPWVERFGHDRDAAGDASRGGDAGLGRVVFGDQPIA